MGSRGWRIVRLPSTRLSIMQNNSSQIQKALMVFKSLNGLVPEYLTSKFVTRNVSNYALKDSANKLVPFPRTNYMKNSCCEFRSRTWPAWVPCAKSQVCLKNISPHLPRFQVIEIEAVSILNNYYYQSGIDVEEKILATFSRAKSFKIREGCTEPICFSEYSRRILEL